MHLVCTQFLVTIIYCLFLFTMFPLPTTIDVREEGRWRNRNSLGWKVCALFAALHTTFGFSLLLVISFLFCSCYIRRIYVHTRAYFAELICPLESWHKETRQGVDEKIEVGNLRIGRESRIKEQPGTIHLSQRFLRSKIKCLI